MIEENHLSKSCFYYETFMERSYGSLVRQRPVLQASGMRNLIMAEKGITVNMDSIAHFEEQLQEIKKYMEEAFDRYMATPNAPGVIVMELMVFKNQVAGAASSKELMKITLNTIDLTNQLFKTEQ